APAPAVLESEPAPGPAAPPLTTTVPSTTTAAQPTQTTTAAQQPAPARPVAPKYSLADFPSTPDSPSDEISPDQAIALWQLKVPFLDARRSDVYRQGHIAGARSFPVWESDIDARVTAFYEEGHDQEKPVVLYCSGGACEDSHMLAQKLWGLGFNNVLVYTEGWPDWARRGLPARQGDQP
ncbi:MAG TPA: rhodanese-like domain-containing protein, partial [Thermoanaerobaculia bacterium]|nr:rhodanese-like domain-containing protein [Thermoanaerobaculia bacterium]